jgi:hypothetical protein
MGATATIPVIQQFVTYSQAELVDASRPIHSASDFDGAFNLTRLDGTKLAIEIDVLAGGIRGMV